MAYGPQSVSLTQSGGDLDLLEALRGGRSRAKTQQEMLREQSMSPVEIGSYNGIQGKFPISQGINKIAQGLLATYMDSQARDRAQAAADAQKDEAQKYAAGFAGAPAVAGVNAVLPERGTVAGPVVDGVDPETPEAANSRIVMDQLRRNQPGQEGVDYRATAPVSGMPGQRLEAAPGQGDTDDPGVVGRDAVAAQPGTGPTPAQRTAMLLQGMASSNPAVNRMATLLGNQDAEARLQKDRLDDRGFQAEQQRELIAANRDIKSAETQPARTEEERLIAQNLQHRKEAKEWVNQFDTASPEEKSKMLNLAPFSGNPLLISGATHLSDQNSKGKRAEEDAALKRQLVTPAVLKLYTDSLNIYKMMDRTINQIDQNLERIENGELSFDLFNNTTDTMRNFIGLTSDQSRAKAAYENDVKRLANDVLQTAKGTQTEGDARRAHDLIAGNLKDPVIVRTQLIKLRQIAADNQNTAATSVNIAGKTYPGLGHELVAMAKPEPKAAPKPASPLGDDPKPSDASASLPKDALANLRKDQLTEFGNGQVWTLKDGNAVQVK